MLVEVVHMKNYGKVSKDLDGGGVYIYCGRPSVLGNPYYMAGEAQRLDVISKCSQDVKWNETLDDFVKWVDSCDYSVVKLGCFCAPKPCHCDLIKDRLNSEFNSK